MSRFALQWLLPGAPDRVTHVMLLDRERPAPYTVAAGHGAGKEQALLDLLATLREHGAPAEAIDYVEAKWRNVS